MPANENKIFTMPGAVPGHRQDDGGTSGGGEPPYNSEMEKRLTALETRLEAVLPTLATKEDFALLRGDMHENNSSIKNWMIATIISLFLGFAGLFFAMSNSLKPSPPSVTSASPAPVVIQLPAPAVSTAPQSPQK